MGDSRARAATILAMGRREVRILAAAVALATLAACHGTVVHPVGSGASGSYGYASPASAPAFVPYTQPVPEATPLPPGPPPTVVGASRPAYVGFRRSVPARQPLRRRRRKW